LDRDKQIIKGINTKKVIEAKILDPTHLELEQPIISRKGEYIQISISDDIDDDNLWRDTAKKHFLKAYDDQDSIYDEL